MGLQDGLLKFFTTLYNKRACITKNIKSSLLNRNIEIKKVGV